MNLLLDRRLTRLLDEGFGHIPEQLVGPGVRRKPLIVAVDQHDDTLPFPRRKQVLQSLLMIATEADARADYLHRLHVVDVDEDRSVVSVGTLVAD